MDNKIKVVAIQDFTVYNHDRTELIGDIKEGKVYESELYKDTEEYFTHDDEGREVYVGEVNRLGGLDLDDGFEVYVR